MKKFGIELLVVLLAVLQILGFISTYIIAVQKGHVTPGFPYISDTGGKPPESCIFTLICSLSAVLCLIIVYIRYQYIHQYYRQSITRVKILNFIAFGMGLISSFGLLVVGAFQEDEVSIVHLVGAMLVFVGGVAYAWLHTFISYRIYHASLTRHISSLVILIRLLLSLTSTVLFAATVVLMQVATYEREHKSPGNFNPLIWTITDGGFGYHVASTIAEWGLGLSFLLFFLTFHTDFARINLAVSVTLRYHGGQLTESTPLMI